ncbi:hypothetical protein BU23DRAFT_551595 [Bimuria novae-zelandiae CBS 107.79]|uniref:RNA-binding domain-containing protein n=1 Tax=Bimuria novae-zelandiae CBS 107.79 TaxID=1447943 RepID=A0A6A5VHI8_9PLEO|nr:hypothetical protein BU23DRAFT_551595 [Bimuria novae-zelandiae CBS 107.79]
MQLQEQDKSAFKQWLLPKLANRSEAEPEVLVDYVTELFGGEGSIEEIKRSSVEQLSEFLADYAQTFVDEVAAGIEQKIWNSNPATETSKQVVENGNAKEPAQPAAQPTPAPPTGPKAMRAAFDSTDRPAGSTLAADAPVFVPRGPAAARASSGRPTASLNNDATIPTGPRADRVNGQQKAQGQGKTINGRQNQSKKRKLNERDTSQSRNSGSEHTAENSAGERPHKQLARKAGGNIGRNGSRANPTAATASTTGLSSSAGPFTPRLPSLPSLPPLPQFPSATPLNPMEFFINMSAMMSQVYSGQALAAQAPNAPRGKCTDYETKGICKLGTFCPYEHGSPVVVPADPPYDPNNSALAMQPHINARHLSNVRVGNSFGTQRRERTRANFSQSGLSIVQGDTVVVEQIPEDHFTEQHVRDYFSQFGPIIDVQMHAYKRLAVVKFSDHPAAKRAYNSPKAIFDNRFVKVYWHKPENLPQANEANVISTLVVAKADIPETYNEDDEMIDLEEVKKHQARLQKEFEEKRKMDEEAAARSRMLDAQARAKEEEMEKLRSKIIEIERAKGVAVINQKEQRASANDLAKLASEAAGLFVNAGSPTPPTAGRGGFTNGRRPSLRGGFRGRGRGGHSGVVRLDNRPRRLAVDGVESGSEKEKALKRYLLNAKGCNGVQPHVDRANTLVVSFDQRFQAEMFLNEASRIPNVRVGDLSWVPNDANVVQRSIESDEPMGPNHDTDDDMSDGQVEPKIEVDLDVAEDTDQWL